MKGRVTLVLIGLVVPLAFAAGVALATPSSGLTGFPLARGSAGELVIHDKSQKLKVLAKEPLDIALVRATLGPNGSTGWHGHSAPGFVVVKAGNVTVYEPRRDQCAVNSYGPGKAFIHSDDAHNFVTDSEGAEIYIVYLLQEGASPAPIDVTPAPAACS
jgi:hypothetical protein